MEYLLQRPSNFEELSIQDKVYNIKKRLQALEIIVKGKPSHIEPQLNIPSRSPAPVRSGLNDIKAKLTRRA